MNLCDRISNQSTIYYSQGKYKPRPSKRQLSSADAGFPGKQSGAKKSPERNSASVVINPKSFAGIENGTQTNLSAGNESTNSYRGKPAVFFEQSVIDSQVEKFKHCLVGKFPGRRPSLSKIREWVAEKWKLKGNCSITLLDQCHVLIILDNEADMIHVWARNRRFVGGHLMKLFKWFPTFVPVNGEPSVAAVWVSLPFLPVGFFQEELLFPIASLAGKVLAVDDPTRNCTRTDVARVCVEVDLLKDLPRLIWVGIGDGGFWQSIRYKKLPSYCVDCRQQGHSAKVCHANRRKFQTRAANLKPRTENPNTQIREERSNPGECSTGSKRVGISAEDQGECSTRSKRVGISPEDQIGCKRDKGKEVVKFEEDSISEGRSPPVTLEVGTSETVGKNKCKEATENRAESSHARTAEQIKLPGEENIVSSGVDVSGGLGSLPETGAKDVVLPGNLLRKSFDSEFEEQKEILRQAAQAYSPPRRTISNSLWKNKQKDVPVVGAVPGNLRPPPLIKYKYSDIKDMTKSFRDMVGEGGHGTVFKGKLSSGEKVAVKVGKQRASDRQFFNEMEIVKNLSHKNIIRLLGFCYEGSKRALVYELMPNGSLDGIIYPKESRSSSSSQLSKRLCEIAVGIAQGLEYLQHGSDPAILHFDIKPRNILLDRDLCPKIADFGLAQKLDSFDSGSVTSLRGTVGYVAPELRSSGRFSWRTDVYSYGIMLLEMALRKKPIDFCPVNPEEKFLIHWVRRKVTRWRGISSLEWEETERKMIIVGLWCTQPDPTDRPSFSSVVEMLEQKAEELRVPPGYYLDLCIDPSSVRFRNLGQIT